MLDPALVAEIRRLLDAGMYSQRTIARMTGVSRGTIGAIAGGKRPDRVKRPAAGDDLLDLGPLERCPGCGGMVYMPCRLCRGRAVAERARSHVRRAEPADMELGLQLRPEHQARYEEIHALRLAAYEPEELTV